MGACQSKQQGKEIPSAKEDEKKIETLSSENKKEVVKDEPEDEIEWSDNPKNCPLLPNHITTISSSSDDDSEDDYDNNNEMPSIRSHIMTPTIMEGDEELDDDDDDEEMKGESSTTTTNHENKDSKLEETVQNNSVVEEEEVLQNKEKETNIQEKNVSNQDDITSIITVTTSGETSEEEQQHDDEEVTSFVVQKSITTESDIKDKSLLQKDSPLKDCLKHNNKNGPTSNHDEKNVVTITDSTIQEEGTTTDRKENVIKDSTTDANTDISDKQQALQKNDDSMTETAIICTTTNLITQEQLEQDSSSSNNHNDINITADDTLLPIDSEKIDTVDTTSSKDTHPTISETEDQLSLSSLHSKNSGNNNNNDDDDDDDAQPSLTDITVNDSSDLSLMTSVSVPASSSIEEKTPTRDQDDDQGAQRILRLRDTLRTLEQKVTDIRKNQQVTLLPKDTVLSLSKRRQQGCDDSLTTPPNQNKKVNRPRTELENKMARLLKSIEKSKLAFTSPELLPLNYRDNQEIDEHSDRNIITNDQTLSSDTNLDQVESDQDEEKENKISTSSTSIYSTSSDESSVIESSSLSSNSGKKLSDNFNQKAEDSQKEEGTISSITNTGSKQIVHDTPMNDIVADNVATSSATSLAILASLRQETHDSPDNIEKTSEQEINVHDYGNASMQSFTNNEESSQETNISNLSPKMLFRIEVDTPSQDSLASLKSEDALQTAEKTDSNHLDSQQNDFDKSDESAKPMEERNDDAVVVAVASVGAAETIANYSMKESKISGSGETKNNSHDSVKTTNSRSSAGSSGESKSCTAVNQQSNNVENEDEEVGKTEQNETDTTILAAGVSTVAVASVTGVAAVENEDTNVSKNSEVAEQKNKFHENNKNVCSEKSEKDESDTIVVAIATVGAAETIANDTTKESKISASGDSTNNSHDSVTTTNARASTGSSGEFKSCIDDNQQSNNVEKEDEEVGKTEQNETDTIILVAGASTVADSLIDDENTNVSKNLEVAERKNISSENDKNVSSEKSEKDESDKIEKPMERQNDDTIVVAAETIANDSLKESKILGSGNTKNNSHDNVNVTNDSIESLGVEKDTIILAADASIVAGTSIKNEDTNMSTNSDLAEPDNKSYENDKNVTSERLEIDETDSVPTKVSTNSLRTSEDVHHSNLPLPSNDKKPNELNIQTEPSIHVEERNDLSPKSTGNIYRSGWKRCLNEEVKSDAHHFSRKQHDPELAEAMVRRKRLSNEKDDKSVKKIDQSMTRKSEKDIIYRSGWTRPLKNSNSPTSYVPM